MSPLRRPRHHSGTLLGGAAGSGFFIQGLPERLGDSHGQAPSLLYAVFGIGIAIGAIAAAKVFVTLGSRLAEALGSRRARRRRLEAAAAAEMRARAMMSELCPHGWRAQITLFGPGDELPPDAPTSGESRIALDWAELEAGTGRVAVVRRVWAPSVAAALEAMVSDRQTDETLEQIERGIVDDIAWPES